MNTYLLVILAIGIACVNADISCYQCISSVNATCDSSELTDLSSFKKSCPALKEGTLAGQAAIGCRKVVQKVEEDPITIIRECAYSGKPNNGEKKSGNYAISKLYYQCANEKDNEPCNPASGIVHSILVLLMAVWIH